MLHSTLILFLLAGATSAQSSKNKLNNYARSMSLSASFNPIKNFYPAGTSVAPVQSSAATEQSTSHDKADESSGSPICIETTSKPASTAAPEDCRKSALHTFKSVTFSASIIPPTTSTIEHASTSLPPNDDQPAPYKTIQIPASESFNPSDALAFTENPIVSIGPEYSSTPRSSHVVPSDAVHSGHLGYGWGHPRPSGFWPSRGYANPTIGFGPRASDSFEPEKNGSKLSQDGAKSTPCTLETMVRPTVTA